MAASGVDSIVEELTSYVALGKTPRLFLRFAWQFWCKTGLFIPKLTISFRLNSNGWKEDAVTAAAQASGSNSAAEVLAHLKKQSTSLFLSYFLKIRDVHAPPGSSQPEQLIRNFFAPLLPRLACNRASIRAPFGLAMLLHSCLLAVIRTQRCFPATKLTKFSVRRSPRRAG